MEDKHYNSWLITAYMSLYAPSKECALVSEMKSEVLEKEKQVRQLKKFEEEHVQNLEKQLALYQVCLVVA